MYAAVVSLSLEPAHLRVVFDTEEHARRATPPESSWDGPGVTIDGVEFRRVAVRV